MAQQQKNMLKTIVGVFGLLGGLGLVGLIYLIVFGNLSGNLGFGNDQTTLTVTNQTGAYLNVTGYQLTPHNSSTSTYTLTKIWGGQGGKYNITIPVANATVSSTGLVTNATTYTNANVSYSFTYVYTYPSAGLTNTNSVIGNVTGGFTSFFSNYGTLFTILFVVALISIISFIWIAFKNSKMGASGANSTPGFSG